MLSLAARIRFFVDAGYSAFRVAEFTGVTVTHATKIKSMGYVHPNVTQELQIFRKKCKIMREANEWGPDFRRPLSTH